MSRNHTYTGVTLTARARARLEREASMRQSTLGEMIRLALADYFDEPEFFAITRQGRPIKPQSARTCGESRKRQKKA